MSSTSKPQTDSASAPRQPHQPSRDPSREQRKDAPQRRPERHVEPGTTPAPFVPRKTDGDPIDDKTITPDRPGSNGEMFGSSKL